MYFTLYVVPYFIITIGWSVHSRVNGFPDVGHQLHIDFLYMQALSLFILHCNSSSSPLKLGFELFIFVYFLIAHHISLACYHPCHLTNHTTSLHTGLTHLLG